MTGVLVLVLAELFSVGRRPIDTKTLPPDQLSAEACGGCHQAAFAEWQDSRHRLAWTNDLFQYDYRKSPRAWCRNCHAPLAAQQRDIYQNTLAGEGVNCVACHVRDGVMYARTRRAGSPHETRTDTGFGGPSYCAGCHQFNFPVFDDAGNFAHYSDEPMQNTVAQHRARNDTDECLDCHGGGHRFPGAHDETMLARALEMSLCKTSTQELQFRIRNRGAGHNVPTGDVHRHIVVTAWRSTAPELLQLLFLGRRFQLRAGGGRETIWDSTLPPGAERLWKIPVAELGPDPEPVNVEARYLFGASDRLPGVGEPTFRVIFWERRTVAEVATCQGA
jgi:hypothetical protein